MARQEPELVRLRWSKMLGWRKRGAGGLCPSAAYSLGQTSAVDGSGCGRALVSYLKTFKLEKTVN